MPAKRRSTGKKSSSRYNREVSSRREFTVFSGQHFPPLPTALEGAGPEALEAFPAQQEYADILETICGAADDSQPVEQYDGTLGVTKQFVNDNQGPVGQIQWNSDLATVYTNAGNVAGVRWASGTLLGNNLFLTAGHVFDQDGGGWQLPKKNGTNTTIPSAEIASRMHVNFNYQVDPSGTLRAEQRFPIAELLEHRLNGLDFAIVRLGGNAAATFGTSRVSNNNAAQNDTICIMGHPAGVPKRIEAGKVFSINGSQIRYDDIDTLGGNSGSGILHANNGRVVGVHTNGGCNPQGTGQNSGVTIEAIIAASPTLQALIASSATTATTDTTVAADTAVATSVTIDTVTTVTTDAPRTSVTNDLATTVIADRVTTSVSSDATLRQLDAQTSVLRDLGGGGRTFKFIDDVKLPGRDKSPGSDVFDPFRNFGRPFALATPHHANEFAAAEAQSQYEAAITELQQLIVQVQNELAALQEHYERLVAEYQAGLSGS